MNKDDKGIVQEFEKHSRPVDRVNYIMQKEMLIVFKNILKELKELKDRD